MKAQEILQAAAGHLIDRAATYDKPEGERSMGATLDAFNAITGDGLMNTEERGWLFMCLLKAVRSQQGAYRSDSYEDGAAYFALAGESAALSRGMTAEFGQQNMLEPASEIQDDSERMQVIGQSGEMAEHVYLAIDLDALRKRAPEGATHYLRENPHLKFAACWYKRENDHWIAANAECYESEGRAVWVHDRDDVDLFEPLLIKL